MAGYSSERAPFNELATLLGRLDKDAFESALASHPAFETEARRGPSAGSAVSSAPDTAAELSEKAYARQRAEFAVAVGTGITTAIEKRWRTFDGTSRWLDRWRVVAIVAAGATGVTTLAAVGVSQQTISHVAGIATAAISVVNSATEYIGRNHTVKARASVADLRAGAMKLEALINQLEAAVAAGKSTDEIVAIMERSNTLAATLRLALDKL